MANLWSSQALNTQKYLAGSGLPFWIPSSPVWPFSLEGFPLGWQRTWSGVRHVGWIVGR